MGLPRRIATLLAGALGLALALPAAAQFSDSYTFLQGVRDRNGDKVMPLVSKPGSSTINTRDTNSGETALHIVVRGHDQTWLAFLLQKGALVDLKDKQGNTPLAVAAQTGDADAARLLLAYQANPNTQNNNGETPLILAVHAHDAALVQLLVGVGANPNARDSIAGKSARDYAVEDRRGGAVLKLLDAAKPKTLAPNIAGPRRQ